MIIGLGRYNLLLKLGQGGMGAVFLARQKSLRRYCAVKLINAHLSEDAMAAERFLREARSTAALTHPNLVSVFDCDSFEGHCFIAMEYIEGKSLGQILRERGTIPLALSLNWLYQAAIGLQYVHGKNVVHRDIKPDNMIIDQSGALKIMDLGLAKDHFEGDQSMTMTGMVMGSPQYMSPEQINDSKGADARTDIYSLGISFYQMLKGEVPFKHSSIAAIYVAHLQEEIPSIDLGDRELTEAMDALILRMTAKDREERFQTAGDLAEVLQSWMNAYPMDENSQTYFANLGMDERNVSRLLQQDGVDETQVDADFSSETGSAGSAPPLSLTQDSQIPVSMTPSQPAESKDSGLFKWVVLVSLLIVLLLSLALIAKKRLKKQIADQAEPPLVAVQPVPKPAPKPIETPPAPPPKPVPPKLGGILVETKPPGAVVMLKAADMQEVDKSPAAFQGIVPGVVTVSVTMPGYRSTEQHITVQPGKVTNSSVELVRIPGSFMLQSNPMGAEIFVSGKSLGKTPKEIFGGDGEELECRLQLNGFEEEQVRITLKEGGGLQRIQLREVPSSSSDNNQMVNRRQDRKLFPLRERQNPSNPPEISPWEYMRNSPAGNSRTIRSAIAVMEEIEQFRKLDKNEWFDAKRKFKDDMNLRLRENTTMSTLQVSQYVDRIASEVDIAQSLKIEDYQKRRMTIFNNIRGILEDMLESTNHPVKKNRFR